MNDRKQHVIKKAHKLFMEKGFQSTSIQDILDYSDISKGTFYNYFTSKSELLIEIIRNIYTQLEKERNNLLVGQDPANIEIFIQQVDLQLKTNRVNKLIPLFEEVLVSSDEELKQFLNEGRLKMLRWLNKRFIEIFGESKEPYLLDCTIMFMGILQNNLKYYALCYGPHHPGDQIVRYCVERIVTIVNEVSKTGDQLIRPEVFENLLPKKGFQTQSFQQQLYETITNFKNVCENLENKEKYYQLLDFIQDELIGHNSPRKFLIKSALDSLKSEKIMTSELLQELETIVEKILAK